MTAAGRTIGSYTLEAPLGRGAVGEVWRARGADGAPVALKLLIAGEHAAPEIVARFEREARVAAALEHPGIVRVLDVGVLGDGRERFIAMELVEGETLAQRLARGPLPPGEALRIALEVAQALEAAHAQGVVHRDVKPGNVLLDATGRARVADFGLAKVASESGLTTHGALLGTPSYMAPEQAFGAPEAVDHRADVHALGAVIYEMLAGRPPYVGATSLAVLRKLEEEEPPPPSSLAGGGLAHLDAVVLRALRKDPAARTPSARALRDELLAALAGAPTLPPGATRPPSAGGAAPPARAAGGRRAAAGLAAALVAGAALLLLLWEGTLARADRALLRARYAPRPERHVHLEEALALLGQDPAAAASRQGVLLTAECEELLGRFGAAARTLERDPGSPAPYEHALLLVAARPHAFHRPSLRPPALRQRLAEVEAALPRPAERFLVAALGRALAGATSSAEDQLAAAEAARASQVDVALARARVRLAGHVAAPTSASAIALDEALARLEPLRIRPGPCVTPAFHAVEALALRALGDARGAQAAADRLLQAAPTAAETYLVRADLHASAGRWPAALDDLETARRLDPACDAALPAALVRVTRALEEQPTLLAEATWQDQLLAALGDDPRPAAHLLRALVDVLRERWDGAATHLAAMAAQGGAPDVEALEDLARAAGSPARLLAAGRDLLALCDRYDEAIDVGRDALDVLDEVEDADEARALRIDGELAMARLLAEDEADAAVPHLRAALEAGARRGDVEDDEDLAPLLGREDVRRLLAAAPPGRSQE